MTDWLIGQDLGFSYGRQAVFAGASFTLRPGRATVLLGPSGSGKSTLIWLLAGLLPPTTGRVVLRAAPPSSPPRRAPSAGPSPPRPQVGMVFQQSALWDHLTVEQHLKLVLAGKGLPRAARRERVGRLLDRLQLADLRRRRPGELSGGQQRRLAIARALVVEPAWLLLDEPLAHLDGSARADLFSLLAEVLAESRAGILLATHNPHEALRLADEVVVLLDGRIVQQGPAEEVYRCPVSLAAARVLGPAGEIGGWACDGRLFAEGPRGGPAMLEGLDPASRGNVRLILRPEQVRFVPDPAGPAVVSACTFAPGSYSLTVRVGPWSLPVLHPPSPSASAGPLAAGTPGRLVLLRPGPPPAGCLRL